MNFTTKFSLGDKVTAIYNAEANHRVKCVTCNNTGKVTIGPDEFQCPKCGGQSTHLVYAGQRWFVQYVDATVGRVGFEVYEETFAQEYSQDPNPRIQYMLEETGIRSGTLWPEGDLFSTRTMAQLECDERNSLLKKTRYKKPSPH